MAKYEKHLVGDFDAFLEYLFDGIMNGSVSASYEDGSEWTANGVRVPLPASVMFRLTRLPPI